jgi:hypothetical protein
MMRAMLLIGLVKGYRLVLSPWIGSACRFTPTCSAYSLRRWSGMAPPPAPISRWRASPAAIPGARAGMIPCPPPRPACSRAGPRSPDKKKTP